MVRVLVVADEEDDTLFAPGRLSRLAPELVLGAGDLAWSYLETIASCVDAPFLFVPGNHDPEVVPARRGWWDVHRSDGRYSADPRPHGARNVDLDVIDVAGLRVAGLGGCVRYRPGPNQYTQREYVRRAAKLVRRAERLRRRDGRGVDVLLTHAPPRGCGDGDDAPHHGIEALHDVIATLTPTRHLHGHIHPYGRPTPDRTLGATTVTNVVPHRLIDVAPRRPGPTPPRPAPARGSPVSSDAGRGEEQTCRRTADFPAPTPKPTSCAPAAGSASPPSGGD